MILLLSVFAAFLANAEVEGCGISFAMLVADVTEEQVFEVTADEMREALWYYDNYFIVKDERDYYKEAYEHIVDTANGVIAENASLDGATKILGIIVAIETIIIIILSITNGGN